MLDTLKKHGVMVERYNLSSAPGEFITNQAVNAYINAKGPEGLPAIIVDGELVITGRYPTNAEFTKLLDLPEDMLKKQGGSIKAKVTKKTSGGCNCKGGCC